MKIEKKYYHPQKYVFKKYDKIYPVTYEREKAKLLAILPKNVKIEHVGSTAVPGLGGKGIIDIAILTSKKNVKDYMAKIRRLGYESNLRHPGDDRRIFMQKVIVRNGKERRIHVHLCLTREFFDSFIVFRDYLIGNKNDREEYARVKKEGARMAKGYGDVYGAHKEEIIVKLFRRALKGAKTIKIEIKSNKKITKKESEMMYLAKKKEFGSQDIRDFRKGYPNSVFFFVKDGRETAAFGALRKLTLEFEGKKCKILGICNIFTIKRGQGYGKILMRGVIRYIKKSGKTGLGFCIHDKMEFYRKAGFKVKKDLIEKVVYKNPEGKLELEYDADALYIDGKDKFVSKLIASKEISYTDLKDW